MLREAWCQDVRSAFIFMSTYCSFSPDSESSDRLTLGLSDGDSVLPATGRRLIPGTIITCI